MPTIQSRFLGPPVPKYRKHKASGQAVVTLNGQDCYLGPWGSTASRIEYDRLVGEWIQNGRRLLGGNTCDLAVVEIINAYRKYADTYYVKHGQRTREAELISHVMVQFIQPLYGRTLAIDFGPCALKTVRQKMIEAGHSRGVINKNVDRIRRMFRWAASEEMVLVTVPQALATVAGLRKGRTTAREPVPVKPVGQEVVEATLPHLSQVLADMVRFQRLTGCRPGEMCQLRPMDPLDQASESSCGRTALRGQATKLNTMTTTGSSTLGRKRRKFCGLTCNELPTPSVSRRQNRRSNGWKPATLPVRLRHPTETSLLAPIRKPPP